MIRGWACRLGCNLFLTISWWNCVYGMVMIICHFASPSWFHFELEHLKKSSLLSWWVHAALTMDGLVWFPISVLMTNGCFTAWVSVRAAHHILWGILGFELLSCLFHRSCYCVHNLLGKWMTLQDSFSSFKHFFVMWLLRYQCRSLCVRSDDLRPPI